MSHCRKASLNSYCPKHHFAGTEQGHVFHPSILTLPVRDRRGEGKKEGMEETVFGNEPKDEMVGCDLNTAGRFKKS